MTEDRVREYAEALYAEQGGPEPFDSLAPSFRARWLSDARACVEVEKQHTAEVEADNKRMRAFIDAIDSHALDGDDVASYLGSRALEAEQEVERLRGEVRALTSEGRSMGDWTAHHAQRAEKAEAEIERLTHLLGSHADGHRCTCTMTDPGNFYVEGGNAHPPEWEQDPWCPTHPDVNQIEGELRNLALKWEADADANEDTHPKEARAVMSCARELLAALRGPEPTEEG